MLVFHKALSLVQLSFFCLLNDLPDIILSKIAIYADDATTYFGCEKGSDMWKQAELSLDLKTNLRDTVE